MVNIETLLGKVFELNFVGGQKITGYLTKPENNIWFTGKMRINDYREIQEQLLLKSNFEQHFSVFGKLDDLNVIIKQASFTKISLVNLSEFLNVNILPYDIIFSDSLQDKPNLINNVSFEMKVLNRFYNKKIVNFDYNNLTCEINKFRKIVHFSDNNLHLSIDLLIKHKSEGVEILNKNTIALSFGSDLSITEVINHIDALRIFLCFLADGFIQLPYKINFSTKVIDSMNDAQNTLLWLNDSRFNQLEETDKPFKICFGEIENNLSEIYNNWFEFWNDKENMPIIHLFVQIISNKSVGLNRFLNLCQTLEVYSRKYRENESMILLKQEQQNGHTDKNVTLFIRLKDLLLSYNNILNEEPNISSEMADIRNYYTHYNSNKRKKIEEKYGDINNVLGKYDGILHYLLLSIIYQRIGIPDDTIKSCLDKPNTRFGIPTEELFSGPIT